MKKIVLIFLIMLLSFSSSPCLAASQVIDNGIAYFYSSQATDGRWIGNTTDDFYTTTEVLNSLFYLSMTGNEYISGRNWIASQSEEDIDFLTRRVFFLNSSADVEALLSYRNQKAFRNGVRSLLLTFLILMLYSFAYGTAIKNRI